MAFLAWLSASPVGEWVSGSTWVYPGLLFVHTLGLGILVGLNSALGLRLLGFAPQVPVADLEPLFPYMWAGFWVNAFSGVLLLIAYPTKALTNPLFYLKLTLIGVGLVLAVKIRVYVTSGAVGATDVAPGPLRRLASVSLLVWVASITAGRLLAYTCSRLTVETSCR